jgi:hypothetical protein
VLHDGDVGDISLVEEDRDGSLYHSLLTYGFEVEGDIKASEQAGRARHSDVSEHSDIGRSDITTPFDDSVECLTVDLRPVLKGKPRWFSHSLSLFLLKSLE